MRTHRFVHDFMACANDTAWTVPKYLELVVYVSVRPGKKDVMRL